jgi:hypothetical protein
MLRRRGGLVVVSSGGVGLKLPIYRAGAGRYRDESLYPTSCSEPRVASPGPPADRQSLLRWSRSAKSSALLALCGRTRRPEPPRQLSYRAGGRTRTNSNGCATLISDTGSVHMPRLWLFGSSGPVSEALEPRWQQVRPGWWTSRSRLVDTGAAERQDAPVGSVSMWLSRGRCRDQPACPWSPPPPSVPFPDKLPMRSPLRPAPELRARYGTCRLAGHAGGPVR